MNVQWLPNWLRIAIKAVVYFPIRAIVIGPFESRSPRMRRLVFNAVSYTRRSLLYSKVAQEHFVVDSADRVIGYSVFSTGQFEFDRVERVFAKLGVHAGTEHALHALIDIGANIGTVCVPAVNRGFAQTAVAIEPGPGNVKLLRANIALNGLAQKIEVHECAVGAEDSRELVLELSDTNLGDHRIRVTEEHGGMNEQARNTSVVRSSRLDDIVLPKPGQRELLWIDVQGYEGYVLAGAAAWLAAGVPACIEFWPYGLKRAGSYHNLKLALAGYRGFYDLNEMEILRPIAELDAMYVAVGETGAWTDLLFVAR